MAIVRVNKTISAETVAVKKVEFYSPRGYRDSIKEQCLTMYVNGLGFRAIERVTGVNHNTVINWVKQAGLFLPDAPDYQEIPEITRAR